MNPLRFKILLGVAALLVAVVIWNWISGWGLITVDVRDTPLSNVIRTIEKQGGIRLLTNIDPETPVDLDVYKVPVSEAVEVLAARLDGRWSVAYVAGSQRAEVLRGIDALALDRSSEDFTVLRYGAGMMNDSFEIIPDPRRIEWTVSPSDDPALLAYLDQFAQKTGLTAVLPTTWNPAVPSAPSGGTAVSAVQRLVKSAGGEVEEIFVLTASDEWSGRRGGGDDAPQSASQSPTASTSGNTPARPERSGNRPPRREPKPEWIEERALAQIALLPQAEQAVAKQEYEESRNFWREVRELPEAERRAAVERHFNDPAVQERMDERQSRGDERRGPDRRADRYRRYIDRKAQAQAGNS